MTTPGAQPASYVQDSRVAGGKLTTHRHLEPKLRISEAVPPLPQTSSLHTYGRLYIKHYAVTWLSLHLTALLSVVATLRGK